MDADRGSMLLEEDRLGAATDVAGRFLANIETVVHGKTEEIKLVLAALACGGHVLLEDVPGPQDGAGAGDRSVDRRRRAVAHPVHARPAADRRHRFVGLQPALAGLRVPAGADLRQRRPRRRDQPRDAEDPVGAARGDGGAAGDRRRRHAAAARSLPAARDREPDRVRGHLSAARRRSSTVSSSRPGSATRASTTSCASSTSSASSTRSSGSGPSSRSRRSMRSGARRSTSTSTTLLRRWLVELVRATRAMDDIVMGGSVRGTWRSSVRPAPGRCSTAAATSSRRTSSGCSCRSSSTASSSSPPSSPVPALSAGRRRSRSSSSAASSSRRARGRPPTRSSAGRSRRRRRPSGRSELAVTRGRAPTKGLSPQGTGPSRSPFRRGLTRAVRRRPAADRGEPLRELSARPARQADRALLRDDAQPASRQRLRRRRVTPVRRGRRRPRHRLGLVGPALLGEGQRRVRDARALRGRGPARGHRL